MIAGLSISFCCIAKSDKELAKAFVTDIAELGHGNTRESFD
jgi:hypothetical protein